ncbi:MAG: deoxyribodipyrimidine photo-lyase [Terrimicrobiaceae bacterium]|nr:deoxyribodipyrimidine photo-lyase [Terrimicrobiaceae bacterium]
MPPVIHWFRRDLRLTDNTALAAAVATGSPVVPVYIVSKWKGHHRWTGPNRQAFLCGCLESLARNLEAVGGRLIIRQGDAVEQLEKLAAETGASAVYFNRDPDPYGHQTEKRLAATARFDVRGFQDVCIHERDEVLNGSGLPFRVFTPYSKAWLKAPKPPTSQTVRRITVPNGIASDPVPTPATWGLGHPAPGILPPGEKAARDRMKTFLTRGLAFYGSGRDLPGRTFTSRISQDLRFGLISPRELYNRCLARQEELPPDGRRSAGKYIAELIWREFYMQILWHFPDVLEQEFNPKFRGLGWGWDEMAFERWCTGETGFPIVDAAMRELRETGFMHNRARMITAMFLTKDLLLDWRMGEQFFMQHLVDGEIASNNGGWQWSAGTGADAAPYFRIQNPWTQTKRYDPDGTYIKMWIPELRDVDPVRFQDPPSPGLSLAKGYPPPMLDHAAARDRALEFFAASS